MKCAEVRERIADVLADDAGAELRDHVAGCVRCSEALAEFRAALAAVTPSSKVQASSDFKERVMREVVDVDAAGSRRSVWFGMPFPRMAWAIPAAVLLIVGLPLLTISVRTPNGAVALLADSAQAMAGLRSVHLTARMRTVPVDNFEMIGTKYDFVPLDMWKAFTNPPRWRVEKPGRVVVMDGVSALMLIGNRKAVRGGPDVGFVLFLKPLLDADQVLANELRAVRGGHAQAALENRGAETVLTISRKAQGDFTNEWAKNTSVVESDHTCVYRFDATSKRLIGMRVLVGNVTVLEITSVEYDRPLPDSLFKLDLPADVSWYIPPEEMPKGKVPSPTNAKEAATLLFEALSREEWDGVLTVWPEDRVPPAIRTYFGGLQVVNIGTAFKSGSYPGWFVPYEVRLRNGETKKFNLAVRNDNAAGRWIWDGGL